jgi:hypothetical protein
VRRCRGPSTLSPHQYATTPPILSNRTHPTHTIPLQSYSSSHIFPIQPDTHTHAIPTQWAPEGRTVLEELQAAIPELPGPVWFRAVQTTGEPF